MGPVRAIHWLATLFIALASGGCETELGCDPGNNVPCACPAGGYGRHICLADGSGYGACMCGVSGSDDAGALPPASDMPFAGPVDFSTAPPDFAVSGPPDLVLSSIVGTMFIGDVTASEAGMPVRELVPVVRFESSAEPHDFNNMGQVGGCIADHYDVANNKVPSPDLDAGEVVFFGVPGNARIDGQTVPNDVYCARVNGFYQCAFGPLVNGAPGPFSTASSFFPPNATLLPPGPMYAAEGYGGADVGLWKEVVTVRDAPFVKADFTTVKYDPTRDFVMTFDCPTEPMNACGFTVVAVYIDVSDQAPASFALGAPSFGSLVCFGLAGPGALTVNQGALAAAFGCDGNGANCDPLAKSVRTRVVRTDVPVTTADNGKAKITALFGRGLEGIAPR